MSLLAFFDGDKVTAVIKRRAASTKVNGVITPGALSTVETVDALYWEGAAAESFVSERFRDTTDAAISVDVDTDIQSGDVVTVQGNDYDALDPDNVGAGGEHLLVALQVKA